jgi:thioredoxin reductase (NADPH)
LLGKGISSCAPCDAPFYKNKKVAVVGGGDSAMEEALILTKYATEVTIIHRRNEFKASKVMQDKVLNNEKIKILWDTNVKEAQGKEKLEKLLLVNNKTNETSELIVDGMFVAIGHSPLSSIFQGKLDIDEKGFIKKYEKDGYHSRTNKDGIFVAGDVHDYHYKQAITAAAFGCMAALDTIHYLDNQEK